MNIFWFLVIVMTINQVNRSESHSVERKIIFTDKVPAPLASYSQAVQINDVLYISGNLGMTKDGHLVEGVTDQTKLALNNVGHILQSAGITFDNVVKVTVMLSDIEDYAAMNIVYESYFKDKSPARSVFMATLPRSAEVEIEAVAIVGDIVDVEEQINDASRVLSVFSSATLVLVATIHRIIMHTVDKNR